MACSSGGREDGHRGHRVRRGSERAGRVCASPAARPGPLWCGAAAAAAWYDRGEGRRRWRALDLGTVRVLLEADAPRVTCREHGAAVAAVPWARHGAGHTTPSTSTVAWLATQCSKTAVTELMRIAWRTVGAIIARVWADVEAVHDRFAGLRRIGIDEISYKRGHRYLTVVVDHDSGRLVWAAPGRDKATLDGVLRRPGSSERGPLRQITHVSADGADWIADVVADGARTRCGAPTRSTSSRWATEALDEVRRQAWNDGPWRGPPASRRAGPPGTAKAFKRARYALWKNPENLTDRAAGQAGLDRQDRPPAAPRLPAQGRPAAGVPARLRRGRRAPSDRGSAGPAAAGSPRSSSCRHGS